MPDRVTDLINALNAATRRTAVALRGHGVTPTLGVVLDPADDRPELALRLLADDAERCHVTLRFSEGNAAPRIPALHDLPDSWTPDRETWERNVGKAREFWSLHGQSRPPRGYVSPFRAGADEAGLFDVFTADDSTPSPSGPSLHGWLTRQRLARLAQFIETLKADRVVHGIVCLPPLPHGTTHRDLVAVVPADLDVDGVHPDTLHTLMPDANLHRHDLIFSPALTRPTTPEPVRHLATAVLLYCTAVRAARRHRLALDGSALALDGDG